MESRALSSTFPPQKSGVLCQGPEAKVCEHPDPASLSSCDPRGQNRGAEIILKGQTCHTAPQGPLPGQAWTPAIDHSPEVHRPALEACVPPVPQPLHNTHHGSADPPYPLGTLHSLGDHQTQSCQSYLVDCHQGLEMLSHNRPHYFIMPVLSK